MSKTYFVTGGGTGGHIYPAVAIVNELLNSGVKKEEIYYLGNKNNLEYEIATKNGYNFLSYNSKGMPRKIGFALLSWAFQIIMASFKALQYVIKYKPSVVFATGGYVSAPMIFACIITKTPYMMHDCDAMPGLVTRRLCKRAKYVSLAFEKAKRYIPNKHAIITGNPIRPEFATLSKEDARRNLGLDNKLTLCVMGGSQGAKSINNTVVEVLKELAQDRNLNVIFQTGKKNYDEIIEKLKLIYPGFEQNSNLLIKPYYNDMISVLKASDIVVSRAGSLSLSEICASSTAPILVPYPHAAANHQRINAKCLLDMGACVYIEDKELDPNKLRETVLELLDNPVKMNYLKQNTSHLAKFDAVERIVECLGSL